MMKNFLKQISMVFSIVMLWWVLASSTFAYIQPNDSRALTFNSGKVTLYMGQNNSQFFLDAVHTAGKTLSCEIKAWTTLYPRNNCDDISFSYNGSFRDITIYVQYDNDQGTFVYDASSQAFTQASLGRQDLTSPSYEPPYAQDWYLSLSSSSSSVQLNTSLNLSVEMYNKYGNRDTWNRDTIRLSVLRQSGSAYYPASSSDYYLKNTYYTFTAWDAWYTNLLNYVRFSTSGTYKIRVENTSTNRSSETIIAVGNSGWSNETLIRSFGVETTTSTPSLYQYVTTTLTARDISGNRSYNYRGSAKLIVEKRDNSSSFWYAAPHSEYTLTSSNIYFGDTQQGRTIVSNNLRFSSQGNYRLRVYDVNNTSINGYTTFSVWGTLTPQDNIHRYVGSTYPVLPGLYDTIQLTITPKDSNNTTTNISNNIKLTLERKLLPTSARRTTAGVSLACKLNTTSYNFTSQDNGTVSLTNAIRCTKKWFYRVVISNTNNSKVLWYVYFTILDANDFVSSLYGFTSAQRSEAHEEYRSFMSQVNQREAQYPRLAYNAQWNLLWKNYYVKLNKLAYNKEGRLVNYAAYQSAKSSFNSSFSYMR